MRHVPIFLALVSALGCSAAKSTSFAPRDAGGRQDAGIPIAMDSGSRPVDAPASADLASPPDVANRLDAASAPDLPSNTDAPNPIDGSRDTARGEAGAGAALVADRTSVNLGTLAQGAKATATIVLTNQGNGASGAVSISATPGLAVVGCGGALAAGASCALTITATPASAGAFSGSFWITADPGAIEPIAISVIATVAGTLSLSPASGTFSVPPGQSSPALAFTVTNTGNSATGSLEAKMTGPDAADFAVTANICQSLAPGASCTLSVVFAPNLLSAAAKRAASLVVTDTRPGGISLSAPLSGILRSDYAELIISPAVGDFGSVPLGTLSPSTTFTVQNLDSNPSGVLTVSLSSTEFLLTSDTCAGASLDQGGSCTIAIALKPATLGGKTATLTVSGTGAHPSVKTLTGLGVTVDCSPLTPSAIDFGSVPIGMTSAAKAVTLKNSGGSSSGSLVLQQNGTMAAFPISNSTCVGPLAPGATCSFQVSYSPTETGMQAATITLSDGSCAATVALVGLGMSP